MNDRLIQLLCLVLALGCFGGSAALMPSLNRQRTDLQLTYAQEIGSRLPPEYALLPALGSLRGIFVDMLWYRSEMMKREGKFHEAKNISEFITRLQPRFPDVWVYHAWNQAFNISVETYTPQERWEWVRSGITLLRDQGLVYNPTSVLLYKELGWQLFFKLGKSMDDAHWYYKTQWAAEWHEVLGDPRRGRVEGRVESSGIPVYEATEDFARIADAARTYFAAVRQVDPVTQLEHDQPDLKPLIDAMRGADLPLNAAGLRRIGRLLALENYLGGDLTPLRRRLADQDQAAPAIDPAALDILTDPALRHKVEVLLPFWRAKALIEDYHMKPAKMLEVMRLFGPLDWRHPASHAAYFGYMGVQMAGELRDDNKIDVLNTARGDIHATQLLTDTGNVIFNPVTGMLDLLPDPRFIPAYEIAWDHAIQAVLDQREDWQSGDGARDNFASGHENFLLKAMLFAYFYGDETDARRYFDKARDLYGDLPHNQQSGRYAKTLDDLILTEYSTDWDMPSVMLAFVESQVQLGILNGLRVGRSEVFNRFLRIAQRAYQQHQSKYGDTNIVTGQARQGIARSWPDMLNTIYVAVLSGPNVPLLERSRIWFNTPASLQLTAYAHVRGALGQQCQQQGVPFDRAFPVPPGFVEPAAPAGPVEQPNIQDIERQ